MERSSKAVNDAIKFLKSRNGSPKILVKQIRNLGDTLHLTPVIKHYKIKFPNSVLAFVTGQWYHNAHEHNPYIDGMFLADHNATPQHRLRLWDKVMDARGIDIKIIASIFPFGEVHPQNKWSLQTIADQYLHNAGIKNLQPLGGRDLIVNITDEDRRYIKMIWDRHKIRKLVILEFVSYSREPVWKINHFRRLTHMLREKGIHCASICAAHENHIPGTINCSGITWRQSAALCASAIAVVGVGSGITMLAAAAKPQPKIIELGIDFPVSMKGCGYAPSVLMPNPSVFAVKNEILKVT